MLVSSYFVSFLPSETMSLLMDGWALFRVVLTFWPLTCSRNEAAFTTLAAVVVSSIT